MEFKGTKGKWSNKDIRVISSKSNEPISQVAQCFLMSFKHDKQGRVIKDVEGKANALLISKAPEMLEMLERIMKTYDKGTQTYLDCEKLIKEAIDIK